MRKLKVVSLVLDFTIYPRMNVDGTHVSRIAQAMSQGVEFPPIVICKKTKRVVDGFHRTKGLLRLYGDDAEVECVEKTYRNDGELFLDAIKYNADHGRILTSYDRTHCALAASEMGIDDDLLCAAMHVDPKILADMREGGSVRVGKMTLPLKRTIRHMAGQNLTKGQAQANEKLSGMRQVFYVNQVILLVENDLLDLEDGALMKRLGHLSELLIKVDLGAVCAA